VRAALIGVTTLALCFVLAALFWLALLTPTGVLP
jgi:hypothetical protein